MKSKKLYAVLHPFTWEPVNKLLREHTSIQSVGCSGSHGFMPIFHNKRTAKKMFPGCKIIEITETTEVNTKWE